MARARRFARRQVSSGWLVGAAREAAGLPRDGGEGWARPDRCARCRWRVAPLVGVHGGDGEGAHFSGLERCGSVWACPVCSAVIRAERAVELRSAFDAAREAGYGGLFLTLTLRHSRQMSLRGLLDTLTKARGRMFKQSGWRSLKRRLGILGMVVAVEVTEGANGWHPHCHVWLITSGTVSADALADAAGAVSAMWRAAVARISEGAAVVPDGVHGADLRPVTDAGVADYIAKVQDGKAPDLASELVRGDLKSGRAGNRLPFELLDAEGSDVPRARALWVEYVAATKGRRALIWSRGLRDLLGLDVERTDEEVIEDVETSTLRYSIDGDAYDARQNDPQWLSDVLCDTEADHVAAARLYARRE